MTTTKSHDNNNIEREIKKILILLKAQEDKAISEQAQVI